MPIEIREIIIKATVNESDQGTGGAATAAPAGGNASAGNSLQDAIEQVLQVLDDKKQR